MRALSSLLALIVAFTTLASAVAAEAQAIVTVTPASGPYGTEFQPRVTGLPPGIAVITIMRFPTGEEDPGPTLDAVPPSGEWLPESWHYEPPEPLGRYSVEIRAADGGAMLATGTFTVTGAAAQPSPTAPGRTSGPAPAQVPR